MAYPVTADGLSPEEVSRRCLRNLADYFGELAEGEPPPTESDLEEMQAEEEGWGHQWRAEREEERFQQAEYEARERAAEISQKETRRSRSQSMAG